MKRREFLNISALSLATTCGIQLFDLASNRAFASAIAGKRMFVVFLRGGFDGLYAAPSYASVVSEQLAKGKGLRPSIFVPEDYRDFPPTHPYFQKLKYHNALSILAADNNIALLPHAGSLNTTRSHFEQMDYIESGDVTKKLPIGYLTRVIDSSGAKSAVVGEFVPYSFRGGDPLLISSADNLKAAVELRRANKALIARSGASVGMQERLAFMSNHPDLTVDCPPQFVNCTRARSAAESLQLAMIQPTADVSTRFKLAAELSKTALKPQVISIDIGGWDIHDDAVDRMSGKLGLLANLNSALTDLKTSLGTEWNNSVVVVMSEFGRTILENGTGGVDHGRGGLMMVMGGSVRPPASASVPRVWDLNNTEGTDSSRAFKVVTDYRSVLAQVMIDHLGLPAADVTGKIFPNFTSYVSPGIIRKTT